MIVLNECRISADGKSLVIEASVENLSYYRDVGIAAVIIDTQDTFTDNGPSNRAIYHQSFEKDYEKVDTTKDCDSLSDSDCPCGNIYTSTKALTKNIRIVLNSRDLGVNLNDNIFFVYIVANGVPAPSTPCTMDNSYVMGVAVNLKPIYNMAMKYIKELNKLCDTPRGFIDMILRFNAFKISLRTGNYFTAIKYWKYFFKDKVHLPSIKHCGCNGII